MSDFANGVFPDSEEGDFLRTIYYFSNNKGSVPDYLKHIVMPLLESGEKMQSIGNAINETKKSLSNLEDSFILQRGSSMSLMDITKNIIKDDDVKKYSNILKSTLNQPKNVEEENEDLVLESQKQDCDVDIAGRTFTQNK